MKSLLVFLFGFFFCIYFVDAQNLQKVEGSVLSLNEEYIAGAHVINLTLQLGTTTNDTGVFYINAYRGDSLLITHIGYHPRIFVLNDSMIPASGRFYLVNKVIELEGVQVYALPSDFLMFKKEFANLKLPPDSTRTVHVDLPEINRPISSGFAIKGPFQALYDAFSHEARQKKKLKQLLNNDYMERLRQKRLNYSVLSMITGISDVESINRFLNFCQVPDQLLLTASDYCLYLWVIECSNRYQNSDWK